MFDPRAIENPLPRAADRGSGLRRGKAAAAAAAAVVMSRQLAARRQAAGPRGSTRPALVPATRPPCLPSGHCPTRIRRAPGPADSVADSPRPDRRVGTPLWSSYGAVRPAIRWPARCGARRPGLGALRPQPLGPARPLAAPGSVCSRPTLLPASTRLGPYEILAPLGSGGMGEVYRARDTRLGREVAIKILPEALASDPQRVVRFEREARAVASLAHPGILVLYDVGTSNDLRYVVTELLEGRSLRQRMQDGPLAWRTVAELGIAVAEGLAAAHGKGIVHRDLKPENLFLTADGRPKILDFGIARVAAESPAEASLTQAGAILGTIRYMSPEQVCGDVVDARSDLFSFGIVLYEAIAGRHPFEREVLSRTQMAILYEEPAPLAIAERPVPEAIERIVRRCLEKERDARFQTANDLGFALRAALADTESEARPEATATAVRPVAAAPRRRLGIVAAGLAAALVAGYSMRSVGGSSSGVTPPVIASIAVLPFVDRGEDPAARLLGAGLPRTIIRSLLEVPELTVRPFSTVAQFDSLDAPDPGAIGRQLDVEAVLAGTITSHDAAPAITVELVDVRRNRSLWLQTYPLQRDPLLVQDDILKELAVKLGWRLSAAQHERLARRPTQDTSAYIEYLEGLHAIQLWTVADTKRGIDRLERALARDPEFALAHASLADAYIAAAYIFMEPRVAFEKARKAGLEAMRLDPQLAEAHAAIATVQFHVDWDWAAARRGFDEALRLNPRCTFALDYYAWLHIACGEGEAAIACLEKAIELEPRNNLYNVDLAFVYQHARQFDRAEAQARRALALDPNSSMAPWAMALVHSHRDRDYAAALRDCRQFLARDPMRPDAYAMLGWVLGMSGRPEEGREVLADLDRLGTEIYVRGEARAWLCTGIGDVDAAFRHLDRMCEERGPGVIYLMLDPLFDRLRGDPRFAALLRRIGVSR
ncbi:MAG: protein kinase [Planctomycetota bacterium]